MTTTPGSITSAVVKALPAFFTDSIDQLVQGEANYIAFGEPQGIVAQIGQAVARSACRQYGTQATPTSGDASTRFENSCRPYLNSLSSGGGAGFALPIIGGQCDNNVYNFTLRERQGGGAATNSPTLRANGPLNVRARATGFGPDGQVSTYTIEIFARRWWVLGAQSPPSGEPRWIFFSQRSVDSGDNLIVSLVDVVNITSPPDACGNPAPVVNPPRSIPDAQPGPFRFNPTPDIDVPIDVTVNPDGSITFDIGLGPVTVDLFPEEGGGDGGSGGGDPGDPTDPGSPGSPSNTGEGGDSEGEAPEGEELVGLKVEVIAAPPLAPTTGRVTQTVYRGIGYVRMGYEGRLGVDVSGGVAFPTQFYHAQQRGLTHWAVNANIGFNLRTTPYYRDIQE